MYRTTDLLLPDLTVPPSTALLLQGLDPPAQDIAERAGVGDEVFELLIHTLARSVVGCVERARVHVRDAVDIVIERPDIVLDGGDLQSPRRVSLERSMTPEDRRGSFATGLDRGGQ